MLEHQRLAAMRAKHPDWIWNRSDTHVILGVPRSHEGLKTVVEPGNSFSPGAGTFGVSTWVFDHETGELHAPEQMPLDAGPPRSNRAASPSRAPHTGNGRRRR